MKDCNKLKKDFIAKVSTLIEKKGFTDNDIVKSIGGSPSTIKDFRTNKSDPKLTTVIKVLNVLGKELKI